MTDPWMELLLRMERIADALEQQALAEDDPAGALHGCAGAYADRVRRMARGYGAGGEAEGPTSADLARATETPRAA